MTKYAYRQHNGEHQVIEVTTGEVLARLDASWRYPANKGAMQRYARELCEGKR